MLILFGLMIGFFVFTFLSMYCGQRADLIKDSRRTEFGLVRYNGSFDMIWMDIKEGMWRFLTAIFLILTLLDFLSFLAFIAMAFSGA